MIFFIFFHQTTFTEDSSVFSFCGDVPFSGWLLIYYISLPRCLQPVCYQWVLCSLFLKQSFIHAPWIASHLRYWSISKFVDRVVSMKGLYLLKFDKTPTNYQHKTRVSFLPMKRIKPCLFLTTVKKHQTFWFLQFWFCKVVNKIANGIFQFCLETFFYYEWSSISFKCLRTISIVSEISVCILCPFFSVGLLALGGTCHY